MKASRAGVEEFVAPSSVPLSYYAILGVVTSRGSMRPNCAVRRTLAVPQATAPRCEQHTPGQGKRTITNHTTRHLEPTSRQTSSYHSTQQTRPSSIGCVSKHINYNYYNILLTALSLKKNHTTLHLRSKRKQELNKKKLELNKLKYDERTEHNSRPLRRRIHIGLFTMYLVRIKTFPQSPMIY